MRSLHLPFLPLPDDFLRKIDPVEQRLSVQDHQFSAGIPTDAVQAGCHQGRGLLHPLQPQRENAAGFRMVRVLLRDIADRRGIGPQIRQGRLTDRTPTHPPAFQPGKPERIEQVAEKRHTEIIQETSHQTGSEIGIRYAKIVDFA